jgi:Domain of unknown function (DUF4340)
MNRKQLTILVVACAVLGVAGWVVYNKRNSGDSDSVEGGGRKVFKDFPLNDVERLAIRQGSSQLNVVKQNDVWTVQERNNYPANFATISEFLRKVWELKVAQPVEAGQSQLARLELQSPDKGAGTLVEFKDKSGKNLNTLLLGKKHMRKGGDESGFGGGGFPDGRYIMVGDDIKTVAVVNDAFSNIEPKPEEWLNKDFFKVENLKSISVTSTNATNSWKIEREKENGDWKLAAAKPGESLDTAKSGGVTGALSAPSFNDVSTNTAPDKIGLDKPLVAKLTTFDGFSYDVKVGSKTGEDNYYFQVAVDASLPKERAAGKDEKPEDKTRLDKEFKEKNDKLQEKLKTEKEYGKWTYVVSKWTIDPLFKERKDLLAEKKEEPKAEAGASTNGAPAKPAPGSTSLKPGTAPPPSLVPPTLLKPASKEAPADKPAPATEEKK